MKIIVSFNFVRKKTISDEVRDHGHQTVNYRGPAHQSFNINVTQKQSNIFHFLFYNRSNYDCLPFFKRLVEKISDSNIRYYTSDKRRLYFSNVRPGKIY